MVSLENQQGNEDRGKFRGPKATLSVYKEISKRLGRIFRGFREIRYNPTEYQRINKYLSSALFPTLSEDLFCWASNFIYISNLISNLIRRSFLLGQWFDLILKHALPYPFQPINITSSEGKKKNDQAKNRIDFSIGLT